MQSLYEEVTFIISFLLRSVFLKLCFLKSSINKNYVVKKSDKTKSIKRKNNSLLLLPHLFKRMLRDWVRDHYMYILKLLSNSESGRALVLRVKPIRPYPLRHIAVCKFIGFFYIDFVSQTRKRVYLSLSFQWFIEISPITF